jgi:hypothetical protein
MRVLAAVLFGVCALCAWSAKAADLQTSWSAVIVDDTGGALTVPIDSYRVYACGGSTPIGSVSGSQTSFTEANVSAGNYCREVAAVIGPFEGARGSGSLILVAPGAVMNVNVQAIP